MEQTTQDRKRQWLKSAVEQSGKTIKEVAELAGMDRTELSGMLNGHRSVTDAKLDAALSRLLDEIG